MMKRLSVFIISALFILSITAHSANAANLNIHFIDVGEGDSILIETPGGETILVDSGNLISGYKVAEYLKKNGIEKLDYLIFTHPHSDHIGGAFFILQMIKVKKIFDNGQDLKKVSKTSDIYRWYEDLVRKKDNYHILKAEDSFMVDGVVFKVLWPYQPLEFLDFNTNSLVIMVEYKKFRALLTGDLTMAGERELLKKQDDLKAGILKVGHHGSDSTAAEFLKAVSPKICVISVNKDNIRGYPSAEVLKRLGDSGSVVYRTDEHGDIVISVTEDGMTLVRSLSPEGCSQCVNLGSDSLR